MLTVRGGLAHQRSCERAVRDHCFEIVPATALGKVASAERTPAELDRRLPIRRRQIGRESEIASAGGVPPPAVAVAKRIVPAVVVASRTELRERSRIRGPCQGAGEEGEAEVAKVLCVLYDDPVDGYPRSYARDAIPRIERYYDGQTTPTPERIDFEPGELLGSVSGELGLRRFLEERGHAFVVTSDKDGPDSVFERELSDAEIVISQPFWPAYLTAERIAKAPALKLAVTAGIGSDHVDLEAAIERGIRARNATL